MNEKPGYQLLITEAESLMLEAIAQSVIPHSQRAQALLAVDSGSTVDQAAGVSRLTAAQVRYWIGRFRNARLEIFPVELLDDIKALVEERALQDEALQKKAKKSAKDKGKKKQTSGSGKKDRKKRKAGKKKKDGTSRDLKKPAAQKPKSSKTKKDRKKKAAGKKK